MRLFVSTLSTETNTFAPSPTTLADFEEYGIRRGDAASADPDGLGKFHAEVQRLAQADGHEFIDGLFAFAQPSGRTQRRVYEQLRDELLARLSAALPLDAVILHLHGAMVAEGCDDCEGDILER